VVGGAGAAAAAEQVASSYSGSSHAISPSRVRTGSANGVQRIEVYTVKGMALLCPHTPALSLHVRLVRSSKLIKLAKIGGHALQYYSLFF
jgi:hypothetical protein